jgi:hypothetical protein
MANQLPRTLLVFLLFGIPCSLLVDGDHDHVAAARKRFAVNPRPGAALLSESARAKESPSGPQSPIRYAV